jgi:hypothetical protein
MAVVTIRRWAFPWIGLQEMRCELVRVANVEREIFNSLVVYIAVQCRLGSEVSSEKR